MTPSTQLDLPNLAQGALDALLLQVPISLTHATGDKRETGFPLPIKKQAPDADGYTTQDYRPMAILEYVHEVLSGARKLANQPAEQEVPAP